MNEDHRLLVCSSGMAIIIKQSSFTISNQTIVLHSPGRKIRNSNHVQLRERVRHSKIPE